MSALNRHGEAGFRKLGSGSHIGSLVGTYRPDTRHLHSVLRSFVAMWSNQMQIVDRCRPPPKTTACLMETIVDLLNGLP